MPTMIPAIFFIGNPNAENILIALFDGIIYTPRLLPSITPQDEAKLSYYNRASLDTDLNDKNLEEEIEKLELTKEKSIDLNNLQNEYQKFSANSFSHNRFNSTKPTIIPGVGIDGGGLHPINYSMENLSINKIEEFASIEAKWNPSPGDGEEILKESVKNVCFWQASNLAQFPIGTPVQVCSAVIQLLSPIKLNDPLSDHIEFIDVFTGKEFIGKRPEIEGLRYFIDGNMFDVENKNIMIRGVRDFDNHQFIRFGRNGMIDDKGKDIASGKETLISLLIEYDAAATKTNVQFQLPNGVVGKKDYKLININLRNYIKDVVKDSPSSDKKLIRSVLLFLFTIFFEYACYIFNLYEEKLISKLKKKTSKEMVNQLRRANRSMIGNFILLVNYSLIRKFDIKKSDGEYFDAQKFISVQEVNSETDPIAPTDSLTKVILRIHSDKINKSKDGLNKIRVYFNDEDIYTDNWSFDENEFKPENFPIVFDTNKLVEPIAIGATSSETFIDVNYIETIKRLTDFLLQKNKGEIPKTNGGPNKEQKIIAVGASMQNDEVFQQTFEALDSYYKNIRISKQVYMQFAQLKIDIFRSGFPSDTIIKWYNDFTSKFNIIFTSFSIPQKQEIELLKVIASILNEYKKYRKQELRYMDDKTIFQNDTKRTIGNKMLDISREKYRGILSVRAGLSALMIITIAELSYNIYVKRSPVPSNFFQTELRQKITAFNAEINVETQKILDRQKIQVNRKFGKGSLQSPSFAGLIGPGTIPQPPPQFIQMFSGIFPQGSIPMSMGRPTGAPGAVGRVNLSLENRLKVENLKFWQDLRTIFSGRTLFLPVVKLNSRNNFDDSEFYLINILTSMIFNKLSAIQISENGVVSRKALDSYVLNNGYILLSANTVDLGNPNSWRCVNYKTTFAKLKRSGGTFKEIKKVRGLFFNIIANNATLTEILNVSIPSGSNVSNGLVKYCSNVLKKELPNCNILISRQQFAQTVQQKMISLTGTSGIDLMSGMAFYEQGPYVQSRNSEIVVR